MSKTFTLRSLDVPSIQKFGIGFDTLFDDLMRTTDLQQSNNYPPYNIVQYDDDHYGIELAVAGFKEGELSVDVEKNLLTVSGDSSKSEVDVRYIVHGISARSFKRVFTLAEHVTVLDAVTVDGILTVKLERVVPEAQKPRNVAISFNK